MNQPSDSLFVRAAPLIFVLLWSTGFIGSKYGLRGTEPFTLLSLRMVIVLAVLGLIIAVMRPKWPDGKGIVHSLVAGALVHGVYLGGVFVAIGFGIPAGLSALIPGLQPVLTSTIANRWLGERVSPLQWLGLALGLIGVLLVLHDRPILTGGSLIGWIASFLSLLGITFGTLYQKRYCGGIDWRTGNLFQYLMAGAMYAAGAFAFETRVVHWIPDVVLSLLWLSLVLSIGTIALLYWLIRRSGATQVASMFYLVPGTTALFAYFLFDEKLDLYSIIGMAVCAAGVFIVNWKGAAPKPAARV